MKIKHTLALLMLFFSVNIFSQNYQLRLNDTLINVSIGTNYEVKINGKLVKLALFSKDTMEFKNPEFSFSYPKEYTPSKTLVDDSTIEQYTILTAEGSGIIIQHYSSLNPTTLEEIMLREITKESIEYGYKMKREEYNRTLKSGQHMNVIRATLTYKDETQVYEIGALGKKDEGLMVITINMSDKAEQGKKIINLLWNTLAY